jgi:uncharacterized membrane protein
MSAAQEFVMGLTLFAGPVYAAIGLQKLISSWVPSLMDAWRLDIVQLDMYTAFVLCCSLLNNGASFTFARAWCMVVVAAICELQEVFGSLTWATELGTGRLPFRVLLLWVMIHTPCHELVRLLGARNPLAVASLTALLMTLADLTTDPLYASPKLAGNVVMKLWHWGEPTSRADRRMYGVPIKNFLWWWAAGFIATLLIEILSKFDKAPRVQISRNKLWSVLQCCGWLLNGVFFATLYDVPPGIRFTATMGMIVPSLMAGFKLYYKFEWRAPRPKVDNSNSNKSNDNDKDNDKKSKKE